MSADRHKQSAGRVPCQICQESARGRSLPVAIAVRSWLQRVIIGEGLGGLGFISLGTVGTLLVCCGEFQQRECGPSLKFKDVHTWCGPGPGY